MLQDDQMRVGSAEYMQVPASAVKTARAATSSRYVSGSPPVARLGRSNSGGSVSSETQRRLAAGTTSTGRRLTIGERTEMLRKERELRVGDQASAESFRVAALTGVSTRSWQRTLSSSPRGGGALGSPRANSALISAIDESRRKIQSHIADEATAKNDTNEERFPAAWRRSLLSRPPGPGGQNRDLPANVPKMVGRTGSRRREVDAAASPATAVDKHPPDSNAVYGALRHPPPDSDTVAESAELLSAIQNMRSRPRETRAQQRDTISDPSESSDSSSRFAVPHASETNAASISPPPPQHSLSPSQLPSSSSPPPSLPPPLPLRSETSHSSSAESTEPPWRQQSKTKLRAAGRVTQASLRAQFSSHSDRSETQSPVPAPESTLDAHGGMSDSAVTGTVAESPEPPWRNSPRASLLKAGQKTQISLRLKPSSSKRSGAISPAPAPSASTSPISNSEAGTAEEQSAPPWRQKEHKPRSSRKSSKFRELSRGAQMSARISRSGRRSSPQREKSTKWTSKSQSHSSFQTIARGAQLSSRIGHSSQHWTGSSDLSIASTESSWVSSVSSVSSVSTAVSELQARNRIRSSYFDLGSAPKEEEEKEDNEWWAEDDKPEDMDRFRPYAGTLARATRARPDGGLANTS